LRPIPLFLAGLFVVLSIAATALLLIHVPCPHCLGQGLLTEPPAEVREARWIRARDLTPVPCGCCSDERKVSQLRNWRWGSDRAPQPPFHRAKDDQAFTEARRTRIAELRDEAVRREHRDGSPPSPSSRPDLLPIFVQALDDEDGKVQTHSMLAIAEMSLDAGLPVLLNGLNHDNDQVQAYACLGLGWIGRSDGARPAAVAALKKVLESEEIDEFGVRLQAATSLLDLDELPSAQFFIQAAKEKRLHDPSGWETARKVFVRFRTKEAISLLVLRMAKAIPPETASYGKDLEQLTGQTFGDDPLRWYRWLQENRAALPPQIE
jgi:hypothetical protein